jgi:hypothetical protein
MVMNSRLLGIAASVFLVFLPASALAQSISTLNAQLKQAVDLSDWNKAVQIVDRMIIVEPGQAARLEGYKAQLQQRINATNKSPASSSAPQKTSSPSKATETGNVTVTNAFVARNETEKEYKTVRGEFIPAIVKYDLTGEIYNGTNRMARSVKVFYDIVSWNKDNNQSRSFVIFDVPAHRKASFEEPLQLIAAPLDSKNKYEGVRVQINKVEWIDEDYDSGSNDTRRLFGYWGKL